MLALLLSSALLTQSPGDGTAADADAVRQTENGWSEAFVTGDRSFLEALLAPEYVSVGTTGEAGSAPGAAAARAEARRIIQAVRGRRPLVDDFSSMMFSGLKGGKVGADPDRRWGDPDGPWRQFTRTL